MPCFRQALVEHRAEPDLQVRRPVGGQRPAAGRRAVRARRQQLHPRLPRADAGRRAADAHRLDRPERPLGAESVFIRPVNSLTFNSNYFLPGVPAAATTRSSSAATGATRTAHAQSTTPAASRRRASRPAIRHDDCSLGGRPAARCDADARRPDRLRPDEHTRSSSRTRSRTAGATLQLGVRYDHNQDTGAGGERRGQSARAGRGCRRSSFAGADPGVAFNNFSPRLGFTYDLPATARRSRGPTTRATTARSAPAASPARSTRSAVTLRYPLDRRQRRQARAGAAKSRRAAERRCRPSRQLDPRQPGDTKSANTSIRT